MRACSTESWKHLGGTPSDRQLRSNFGGARQPEGEAEIDMAVAAGGNHRFGVAVVARMKCKSGGFGMGVIVPNHITQPSGAPVPEYKLGKCRVKVIATVSAI